jgi:hypothetical protein
MAERTTSGDEGLLERVKDTYRYLRGGMVVMIVILTAAILVYWNSRSCWATSISAYYFTPVRAVFIAALCALGIMLIAYRGTLSSEDILLDLAGVMAFVVAMVPTKAPDIGCGAPFSIDSVILSESVRNNIIAVAIGLVFAKVAVRIIHRIHHTEAKWSWDGIVAAVFFWTVVVAGAIAFTWQPIWFEHNAHLAAAGILFLALVIVIGINAGMALIENDKHVNRYSAAYIVIAAVMAGALLWGFVLFLLDRDNGANGWPYWMLLAEAALIGSFAAFWITQTIELWDEIDRTRKLQQADLDESERKVVDRMLAAG